MKTRILTPKRMALAGSIALALIGGFVLVPTSAGTTQAAGPLAPVGPSVVLSGSYTCNYQVSSYYVGPPVPVGDPIPPPVTFAETSDSLSLGTTGESVPVTVTGPGIGGHVPSAPGYGGARTVGGTVLTTMPVSGFGTGHSFNDGSIEDCVRFAQTILASARGLGCATSDVRRRQFPQTQGNAYDSASFSFVCEGPQPDIVHNMGELSRAVLALKLQSQ